MLDELLSKIESAAAEVREAIRLAGVVRRRAEEEVSRPVFWGPGYAICAVRDPVVWYGWAVVEDEDGPFLGVRAGWLTFIVRI